MSFIRRVDDARRRLGIAYPDEQGPGLVRDLTGAVHAPMVLTEQARIRMIDRVMLSRQVAESDRLDTRKRVEGLPIDVLVTLEALSLMAEKGNTLAGYILMEERERLGIDRKTRSYRRS